MLQLRATLRAPIIAKLYRMPNNVKTAIGIKQLPNLIRDSVCDSRNAGLIGCLTVHARSDKSSVIKCPKPRSWHPRSSYGWVYARMVETTKGRTPFQFHTTISVSESSELIFVGKAIYAAGVAPATSVDTDAP